MAMQQMLGPISGSSDYEIERSLRFNSADSAYLGRTPSSASNRRTFTFSTWVKRHKLGTDQKLFGVNSAWFTFYFTSSDNLRVYYENSGSQYFTTNAVFRDPSAWYHIVLKVDTTQSTASDRVKIYVNGEELTFSASGNTSQNYEFGVNTTNAHDIGMRSSESNMKADFSLADVHFIDGQALTPSSFGESDDDNNWMPKRYSGSYGTNGFLLKFDDNSSASALGTDSSGNNNTWTVNNLSVAAGAGNDSLIDSPTNYTASSGNNGGNYCTFNSIDRNPGANYSEAPTNGNLDTNPRGDFTGTIPVTSGKWYWEITITTVTNGGQAYMGVLDVEQIQTGGSRGWATSQIAAMRDTGSLYGDGSTGSGVTYAQGDVLGFALDASTGKLWIAKNNTWINSGNPAGGTGHAFSGLSYSAYTLIASDSRTGNTYSLNAGQRPFSYTPPTNFVSICTTNLPDPTIADSSTVMDVKLYTGNGSTQTISGLGFSPDLAWVKQRNTSRNHQLVDTVRGATKDVRSNTTAAESTTSTGLTAFTSNGFTLGSDAGYNQNSGTYVAWAWDAGANSNKTFTVKVVSDSGNKYRFDDFGSSAVTLELEEGSTYVFDQSDSSNGTGGTHPLRFSTTSDGTHNSGSEYTTGVTVTGTPGQAGAKTTITVASGAPTLYYYCSNHSGMGGQANTNSTAGASNLDGTIQATVRANASTGFSIVSYTGNATQGATIGHGLNAVPEFMLVKRRDSASYGVAYHKYIDATAPEDYFVRLFASATDGIKARTNSSGAWFDTAPTSSVFTVSSALVTNGSSATYIAYIWAPVSGYSSFGSWTGNGSTDGPFIFTGMRPALVLWKRTDAADNWAIVDNARSPFNVADDWLGPNLDSAESSNNSAYAIDILSNGFKVRASHVATNASGGTYVWAAFSEHPFKTARAR